jgi:membrane protein
MTQAATSNEARITSGVNGTSSQPTPLWVVALGALMYLAGAVRTRPEQPARSNGPGHSGPAGKSRTDESHESRGRSEGEARGREASHPAEIPAKGWKDIALRIYQGISDDHLVTIAGGVTFFVLLSLFPGIAGLISLYGLYADPVTVGQHLNSVAGVIPEGGLQIIRDQIDHLTSQPPQRLGLATFAGLGFSLWSANGGMKGLFEALNVVYHEKEKRGFIRLNAISLAFTLGGILFILIALAAITVLPVALEYLGLSRQIELLVRIGRWPVLLLIVSFGIALIYRYGPSRDQPQWRWISPGSVFAAVAWLCASLLFSWYTESFGSYNKTYGSLGAAVGFMTWLWISTIIILVGAKLNAEMEHQTARDTTEGQTRPLGQRGARMADTVGQAQG